MAWSATPDDRSGGRRKRGRRGPRWVTDRAREIADGGGPPPHARRYAEPPRRTAGPRSDAHREDEHRRGYDDHQPRFRDDRRRHDDPPPYQDRSHHRDAEPHRHTEPPHRHTEPPHRDAEPPYRRSYHDDRGRDDPPTRRHPPAGTRSRERTWSPAGPPAAGRGDQGGRPRHDDRPDRAHRDDDRYDGPHDDHHDHDVGWDDGPDHRQRRGEQDRDGGPRKLTVTRVAAWRSRQITQHGIAAFRRAATADGADRSGLTALTFPVMASNAADAALAVALANTLFFSAATAESKTKVALYLLITVAPFALLAPVIGPLLDRLQRGRRVALAASFVGRGLLAIVMAQHFDDWLLYPTALGFMVLTRSFGLLKAAVTPRVLPPGMTLTKTNSRLAVFGLAAGGVVGTIAVGFAWALGSAGALWFTAVVCLAGAWLCLRIPAWVEVTEGEVPASLLDHGDEQRRSGRRREPLSQHVVVALWGNGTIRVLTGFLTLFVAFAVKAQTEHSPWKQLVLVGMVGAAAGAGNITGNALGARQHFGKPDQVIITCVGVVLGAAVLAALMGDITTAVVVGLVGSTCSSLAKVCQDAVIQRDMSEESRASAFGRTETILQLGWTFGGALGVLLPPVYWIGFTVVSALLVLGTVQTTMAHRGRSLIPPLRSVRPSRLRGGPLRGQPRDAAAPRPAPPQWERP